MTHTPQNSELAFPGNPSHWWNMKENAWVPVSWGMSLRDYFAGKSLTGLRSLNVGTRIMTSDEAAEMAYLDADAMLKAREFQPK